MVYISLRCPIPMLDNARITEHNRVGRDIYIYIAIRSDQYIISDGNTTYNSSIDTYPYFIADGRNTLRLSSIRLPYNHTFMDIAVTSDLRFGVDCNIIGMTYINTPPQFALEHSFQDLYGLPKGEIMPCRTISKA